MWMTITVVMGLLYWSNYGSRRLYPWAMTFLVAHSGVVNGALMMTN